MMYKILKKNIFTIENLGVVNSDYDTFVLLVVQCVD